VDELPSTITTADQAAVALDAGWLMLAANAARTRRVSVPGLPAGPVGMPWVQHTAAVVMSWDDKVAWPSVLATAHAAGVDATGFIGARPPGLDGGLYASTVTDWQLVPSNPLRFGRGLVVYSDPFAQPPLPQTAPATQHVATLTLTARAYADRLDEALARTGAPTRQLRSEVSQLRLYANRVEALLPELTASWWPLLRAAIESAAVESTSVPAVPGSQYTPTPISLSR